MTQVIRVDPTSPDLGVIAHAADRLRQGGLVAFPTETVYGLGVHALDRQAVRRLFAAKRRPPTDPLIVHVPSLDAASRLVAAIPDAARTLAARFWPGPLTIVLRRSAIVPDEVTAGLDTVAVRAPAHPVARALITQAAVPVAAPSANLFSRPSPTRAEHVLQDLDGRIDLVLDGGATNVGVESTVLDLSAPKPTVLRPGAVTVEMLREVIPDVELRSAVAADGIAAASPGQLARHYSPRAALTLFEGPAPEVRRRLAEAAREADAQGQSVGLLLADEDVEAIRGAAAAAQVAVATVGPAADLSVVASRLYAAMRDLDARGVDLILARGFPADSGLGVAIQDRLRRAAAGRIISV